MKLCRYLLVLLMGFFICEAEAGMIVGSEFTYSVKKGDTIELVGAKTGVNWWKIAKDNKIGPKQRLTSGQELRLNARRIVPMLVENGIIINIPDRTLYFFRNNKLVRAFPVGLGLLTSKTDIIWKTPIGKFKVLSKEKNPIWHVPPSIQEEMAIEGKEVIQTIPPGPNNPLGRYALKTSLPGIMIHETIKPASINQFRSHGCIRVMPQNMEPFFGEVEVNTEGEIIYMPVKAAVAENGRVYLEVHRDFYGRIKNMKEEVKRRIEMTGAANRVDWNKVENVLKERAGIAEDVTLQNN